MVFTYILVFIYVLAKTPIEDLQRPIFAHTQLAGRYEGVLKIVLPLFNISRNIDFQPGFLKSGLTKINFDNGFEFLRSFSWFAIVLVLALK